MDNESVIASGGGNYSAKVLEDREDAARHEVKPFIFGENLNDGNGYATYKEALREFRGFPPNFAPWDTLWMINGEVRKVTKIFGKPVFDFTEE
jgi:hypothetical protein